MQQASRILVVTFRQLAPEYPKRVHIDWVRLDEVKLGAGRRDGVVFSSQSVPFKLHGCTTEEKRNWGTHHLSKKRLAFKIHCDRLTGLLKLMTVFPPSPPLSLQSGSCYCTQSISCILESSDGHQDNHDGTLEVSSGVTSLFSLSLSPTQAQTILPSVHMLILIHTLDKLSSLSKCEPKHNRQQIYTHTHTSIVTNPR